ncbi:MAG: hypothetical protein H0T79_02670 [Deltaproteobacteria bacterium]|nr:hypothetical protein [Deltaproteobacteria bacterium]
MAYILPIPLPEVLVRDRGVVPANDFAHRHTGLAFGPHGRRYLFSELFYNYYRYDKADNRDLNTHLVTIFDAAWNVERVAILEDVMRDLTHDARGAYVFNNPLGAPVVTAAGHVAFSSTELPAIVLDAELVTRVGSLEPGWCLVLPDGTRILVRDRDRLSIAAPNGEPRALGSLLKAEDSYAARTEFTSTGASAGAASASSAARSSRRWRCRTSRRSPSAT